MVKPATAQSIIRLDFPEKELLADAVDDLNLGFCLCFASPRTDLCC